MDYPDTLHRWTIGDRRPGWRLASTFLNFLSNCPCLRCDAHSIHERGATRRVIDDAMGWRDSGLSMSLEKPTAR